MSLRGIAATAPCICVQLKALPSIFSHPVHIPCSKVHAFGSGGSVVPRVVDGVVTGTNDGSALAGVKIHGFSKTRRSSIAISARSDGPGCVEMMKE